MPGFLQTTWLHAFVAEELRDCRIAELLTSFRTTSSVNLKMVFALVVVMNVMNLQGESTGNREDGG